MSLVTRVILVLWEKSLVQRRPCVKTVALPVQDSQFSVHCLSMACIRLRFNLPVSGPVLPLRCSSLSVPGLWVIGTSSKSGYKMMRIGGFRFVLVSLVKLMPGLFFHGVIGLQCRLDSISFFNIWEKVLAANE